MYIVTARINVFWWTVIFYVMAVFINLRAMDLITNHLNASIVPSDTDLWAVTVSGIYVCITGIRMRAKLELPELIKFWFVAMGITFLFGTVLSLYLTFFFGTSVIASALSLLALAVTVIFLKP